VLGGNEFGEIGRPAAAMSFDLTKVDDATDWVEVSAGGTHTDPAYAGSHTCARKSDGRVFCFGSNGRGQLGDGTTDPRDTPGEVLGELRFTQIEAGFLHACAIAENGVVYCWGHGGNRQNGAPTYIDLTQPTAVALPPL
jgi:alpha-tubulin suppressor-like RCC1 family protein